MKGRALGFIFFTFISSILIAQNNDSAVPERCATMERLKIKFADNPNLKRKFELQKTEFNQALKEGRYASPQRINSRTGEGLRTNYTIPVVFHIVLANPNSVTDAQIQAQLDTLNKTFAGTNGDSTKIPSYFKPFFGKSGIQFCLAQRSPDGQSSTGINRVVTNQTSFRADDAVKHTASGGVDAWDPTNYYNVWICPLSNNLLGYATFPNEGLINEQGVVIDYRTIPGGSSANYGQGKSLSHETGHFLNLYHIWGEDNGDCSGSDFIDDTPNQGGSSSGCLAGIKTDNCTVDNGIMYQNYMDYTFDACMVMFTNQQVIRMEAAVAAYRSSLTRSSSCQAPIQRNFDVLLQSINHPAQRICAASFNPAVTITNLGKQTLTSLTISTQIDNGIPTTFNWTGSLVKAASTNITLNTLSTPLGNHVLTIYVTQPNNNPDEDPANDTLSTTFQYYLPVPQIVESFEGSTFPPAGWDIINPDRLITWKRVTGIAKTGNSSVTIDNRNNSALRQKDDLRLPEITLQGVDSAFLSFQVAAAAYTPLNTPGNNWDTLEVLISTDCGLNFFTIYKKFAENLSTRSTPALTTFIPSPAEWRKDSINLAGYIGANDILIAFRNTSGNENNIYLDDVNVRTVTINPNLKAQGILVTPNPTGGIVTVQFFPPPINLRAIQIYNVNGQKVAEVLTNGPADNLYNFNISNQAPGTYIVRVLFSDRIIIRKIIKL